MAGEEVDELTAALAEGEVEEEVDEELEGLEEGLEEEVAEGGEDDANEELLGDEALLTEENGEEVLPEVEEVAEHLKEAAEGSFHLKRMLEQAAENEPAAKKPKTAEGDMVNKLLTKWASQNDLVIRYCLETLSLQELQDMDKANYVPDKFHPNRSCSDILAKYACEARERKGIGGGPVDCLTTFRFRWKIPPTEMAKLKALSHKDLRYVFNNFDGQQPLDEVIAAAATHEPDEVCTENAMPGEHGLSTIGRFGRLELIDPLADAAVFGDANLTFAMKLSKHRKALGHVGRVIATTFEDLPTLRERYKEIDESIAILEKDFAEVYHSVDCTRIAVDPKFAGMESSLGAVYYNFPHSGAVGGFFDGHPLVNWRHENLMRLFFRALRTFVKPGGSVKVASNMGAVGVRYSYIVDSAVENEFVHVETMPFLEWHLHRYGRSYGDRRDTYKRPDAKNNQSYNAQNANSDMVYCFCYAPSGEAAGKPNIRPPPSLKVLISSTDGPFKNLMGASKQTVAQQLHKRFVTEVSGVHVG
jgi:hypothetical protein